MHMCKTSFYTVMYSIKSVHAQFQRFQLLYNCVEIFGHHINVINDCISVRCATFSWNHLIIRQALKIPKMKAKKKMRQCEFSLKHFKSPPVKTGQNRLVAAEASIVILGKFIYIYIGHVSCSFFYVSAFP